jgi:(1->4)-alpha-D-glucan 1-alpha-D-glucosylmutase
VSGWRARVAAHSEALGDRNLEYLLYQTLVGTWPTEALDPDGLSNYQARIRATLIKSAREARASTSWSAPNEAFEGALAALIEAIFRSSELCASVREFSMRLAAAGASSSLVQLVLKLTSPGVPDIYQGSELWDLNLVDPDNRRPVDFERRQALLRDLLLDWRQAPLETLRRVAADWQDGRVKLLILALLLGHRREHPALYAQGSYRALEAPAPFGSFAREFAGETLMVIFARWPLSHRGATARAQLPDGARAWRNLLTGELLDADLDFATASGGLPVIVAASYSTEVASH